MNRLLRILVVLLALAAIGVLAGVGAHGHADGSNHAHCWLCVSSYATIALPATAGVLLLFWVIVAHVVPGGAGLCQVLSAPQPYPRAPPARLPI